MRFDRTIPAVSIVVATYKGTFLQETLLSILGQTFDNFEVLVLDDANDPECRALVEDMRDERFLYVANEFPLRPALNHAKGIDLARGECISILNHDDLWNPDALEKLTSALAREPSAVAAFSRARVADERGTLDRGRTRDAWIQWDCSDYPAGLVEKWSGLSSARPAIPVVPATLIRASTLKKIKIPAAVGGMYDAWIGYRVACSGPVYHEDSPIGLWREHRENLTRRRSAKRSAEPIYFDLRLVVDRALPPVRRLEAARRLPRSVGAWIKDLVRGQRNVSRPIS